MHKKLQLLILLSILTTMPYTRLYAQNQPFGQNQSTDLPPVYLNGDESIIEYLETGIRLRSDEAYIKDDYQRASLQLLIDEQGFVASILAVECTDKALKMPLEELFRQMPAWSPALKEGKAIRSYISIEFTYLISGNQFSIINLNSRFQQSYKKGNTYIRIFTFVALIGSLLFIRVLF